MSNTFCFVSSLVSGKKQIDSLVKFERIKDCDYFLFTNSPLIANDTSWDIVNIGNIFTKNNVATSRAFKFTAHKYLWELKNKQYDVIFYCDAKHYPRVDADWSALAQRILSSDFGFTAKPQRYTDGIYQEARKIVEKNKDTKENMEMMIQWMETKYPGLDLRLKGRHFWKLNELGYAPHNAKVNEVLDDFWQHYSSPEFPTYRDQPLWNLMVLQHKVKIIPLPNRGFFKIIPGRSGHSMNFYNQ